MIFMKRDRGKHTTLAASERCEAPSGWKPWTLRSSALLSFASLSLLLAATIELARQRAQKDGGLALSTTDDAISEPTIVAFLYIPSLIFILYCLLFDWIDLDVKRLQPWVALSQPGGATAEDSVLLEYPFDFIAAVPFKAARRRHWSVFVSGLAVVILHWLVMPLSASIFSTGQVNTSVTMPATRYNLPSLGQQASGFGSANIEVMGYAITWLNQSLPSWSTPKWTLLPVIPQEESLGVQTNSNLTIATAKLWANFSCSPAKGVYNRTLASIYNKTLVSVDHTTLAPSLPSDTPFLPYSIDGGEECSLPTLGNHPYFYQLVYGHPCSSTFVAVYVSYNETAPEITAAACDVQYMRQNVTVQVSMDQLYPYPDSIQPQGPAEIMSNATFDRDTFEWTNFPWSNSLESIPLSSFFASFQVPVHDDSSLMEIFAPTAIALGTQDHTLADYHNSTVLVSGYQNMHELLFVLAASRLLASDSAIAEGTTVIVSSTRFGIIVSDLLALALETLLIFVAFLVAVLWQFCSARRTFLSSEPASILHHMSLIRDSSSARSDSLGTGAENSKELHKKLEGLTFSLERSPFLNPRKAVLRIDNWQQSRSHSRYRLMDAASTHAAGAYTSVIPGALKPSVGFIFVLINTAALCVLVYLERVDQSQNGFARPTNNHVVLQILESYIPTAFATLIGSFWSLLNRALCQIQPYQDLWIGSSRRAITSVLSSVPPQLSTWRALRSRYFLLAAVCINTLLLNILTISLGGLFNELSVAVNQEISFNVTYSTTQRDHWFTDLPPTVRALSSGEAFYDSFFFVIFESPDLIAWTNISSGTALQPWMSEDYYFLPFFDDSDDLPPADAYTSLTYGITVIPSCHGLEDSGNASSWSFHWDSSNYNQNALNVTVLSEDNQAITCSSIVPPYPYWGSPDLLSACELGQLASPGTTPWNPGSSHYTWLYPSSDDPCRNKLVLGLYRGFGNNHTVSLREMSHMICDPKIFTAPFNVTADITGRILESQRIGNLTPLPVKIDNGSSLMDLFNDATYILSSAYWGNDTSARNWIMYLMEAGSNVSTLFDPSQPIPGFNVTIPLFENVYKVSFAAFIQQNPDIFLNNPGVAPTSVPGWSHRIETRIFVSQGAFYVSIVVLVINILTAILLYTRGIVVALPRMPTTIASVLGFIVASRACSPDWQSNLEDEYTGTEQKPTFSFGRYIGTDGRQHVGIDVDPYVTAIDEKKLMHRDSSTKFLQYFSNRWWRFGGKIGE
ncbi:hypothetical protein F5Y16DRAFT_424670 [Xylariaceae sp. FL0255]|nr:hypothetical protein F5Y16DRAFT_424670 [Xylariaceae sp. FL0255]